jgi:uncharacterized membrane protein YqjE
MSPVDPSAPAPGGLFNSLRALLATVVAMAQTRVELLGVELEEEIRRIVSMLVGTMISLALASLALLFGAVLIVVACWDTHRIGAVAAVAAGFAVLAVAVSWWVRSNLRRPSRLLGATVRELESDGRLLVEREL